MTTTVIALRIRDELSATASRPLRIGLPPKIFNVLCLRLPIFALIHDERVGGLNLPVLSFRESKALAFQGTNET